MLIQKGGIRREIDGKRLEEYREKGYKPAETPAPEGRTAPPKAAPGKKG